jgi:hypothetical protein
VGALEGSVLGPFEPVSMHDMIYRYLELDTQKLPFTD